MDMDNNNINKYNLQNRIKWRNIDFNKNIKLFLGNFVWNGLVKALFNGNNYIINSLIDFYELFVYCLLFIVYCLLFIKIHMLLLVNKS